MQIENLKVTNNLLEAGEDVVLVKLLKTRGSAPQEIGASMVVTRQGLQSGTIGGGKVEAHALKVAQNLFGEDQPCQIYEWNLQTDIGMTCGGVVVLSFEKFLSPMSSKHKWTIAVFGAGHVAQELIPLLLKLDCIVYWIDSRSDWLDRIASKSNLKKIHTPHLASAVSELPLNTFIASMTMGHAHDFPVLKEALSHRVFPYVGVIGSDSKAIVLKKELKEAGILEGRLSSLICPIGAPFGNNTPIEIALSVVAQLLQYRDEFFKKN